MTRAQMLIAIRSRFGHDGLGLQKDETSVQCGVRIGAISLHEIPESHWMRLPEKDVEKVPSLRQRIDCVFLDRRPEPASPTDLRCADNHLLLVPCQRLVR